MSGSNVFLIRMGIDLYKAGIMVGGKMTFAPAWANSMASSYVIWEMVFASKTTLGSADKIPFTSVQISISSTSKAAPKMDAV